MEVVPESVEGAGCAKKSRNAPATSAVQPAVGFVVRNAGPPDEDDSRRRGRKAGMLRLHRFPLQHLVPRPLYIVPRPPLRRPPLAALSGPSVE